MRHARSKGFESQRRCALLRSTHSNIATNPSSEAKSLAKPPHFACRSILCRRSGRTLAAKASSTPHTSHCCAATTPHQWRKKYHNFTLPVLTLQGVKTIVFVLERAPRTSVLDNGKRFRCGVLCAASGVSWAVRRAKPRIESFCRCREHLSLVRAPTRIL